VSRLLLVRHGESTWNAVRRWQGQADPPLSPRGERQAIAASTSVVGLAEFDVIVTSHLQRARRTGELLADGTSVELGDAISDLAERAAGEWEGLTRVEIEAHSPGYLAEGRRPTGYEQDESVVRRSLRALHHLVGRRPAATTLVVSHGGVINALERAGSDADPTWERLDNLEGRWFEIERDEFRVVGERVRLLTHSPESRDAGEYA
jgi:broad specificity phosphatase PhoE